MSDKVDVLFQGIGVLTNYNLGLVSALSELSDINITLETNQPILLSHALKRKLRGEKFGVKIIRSPLKPFLGNHHPSALDSLSSKIYNIYSRKFDIIHLNTYIGRLWEKINHSCKIFTTHGLGGWVLNKNKEQLDACKSVFKNCEKVVANSKYTIREVKKHTGHTPSKAIHLGIEPSIFNPKTSKKKAREELDLPRNKKIILWNGAIAPHKDLFTFLRGCSTLIKRKNMDPIIYIKGRGVNESYLKEIKSFIRKNNGLKEKIKMDTSWWPYSKLPLLYRASDVFVHTSLHENFGMVFLEAMATGTPVIAANSTTPKEVLGNSALLFKPKNHEELTEKLLKVLEEEKIQKELSKKGLKRVRDKGFTWEKIAKEYRALYKRVLDNKYL